MIERIEYRKGDRDILISRLAKYIDMESGSFSDPSTEVYTYIKMFGDDIQISIDLLIKIVLWAPPKDLSKLVINCNYFRILFEIIHYVPLKEIPLYINSIPEVAKWRLEIGR